MNTAPALVRLGPAVVAALALLALLPSAACSTPQEAETYGPMPDQAIFTDQGVSDFMEKRCGSIDCHGQVGRPLRLYSEWGLRLESGPGGSRDKRPTTEEERLANYQAVIGLEPDAISDCVVSEGRYVDFQLLLKPLDSSGRGVAHKGGPVLRFNDKGWTCLHGWIAGSFDPKDCADAAQIQP